MGLLPLRLPGPLPELPASDFDRPDGDAARGIVGHRTGRFAEREGDERAVVERLPEGLEELLHGRVGEVGSVCGWCRAGDPSLTLGALN